MDIKQKLAIVNKKKEPIKHKITRNMVTVTHGDITQQNTEAICNSIGPEVRYGFNGAIGRSIVKECGEEIIDECYDETKRVHGTDGHMKVGQFVTTGPGDSATFKHVIHCVCPSHVDEGADQALIDLVFGILMFCNRHMVESFATPPMSSGILGFTFERCARCFFTGIMDFLEAVDHKATMKQLAFVIYEPEKAEEFQEIWDGLLIERFGSVEPDDTDSDEEGSPVLHAQDFAKMNKNSKPKTNSKPAAKKIQNKIHQNVDSSSEEEEKEESKEAPTKKPAPKPTKKLAKKPAKAKAKIATKKIGIDSSDSSSDGEVSNFTKKTALNKPKSDLQSMKSKVSAKSKQITKSKLKASAVRKRPDTSSDDDSSDDAPPMKSVVSKSKRSVKGSVKKSIKSSTLSRKRPPLSSSSDDSD